MYNLYDILGVTQTATTDEIKMAYRRCCFITHPDRNIGDKNATEQFKRVQEAYDTLSDPIKRSRYDRTNRSTKSKIKNKRPYSGDGFVIADAPPQKVDLWGEPIQDEHKWHDIYANSYTDEMPDIRSL